MQFPKVRRPCPFSDVVRTSKAQTTKQESAYERTILTLKQNARHSHTMENTIMEEVNDNYLTSMSAPKCVDIRNYFRKATTA